MIRLFQIAVFSCLCLLLTGCNGPEESEPIWQQVKIGDIAPSHSGKRPGDQLLKTANFAVYIFEIPAENISTLDGIWQMLYTKPLRFNDYDAFGANLFSVGFGEVQMWSKIADLLRAAGGKRVKTVSLLLPDEQAGTIAIAGLGNKQTIFYISTEGSMEEATVGPGMLALRIKAEKIPGSRGVCSVDVQPVFSLPIGSSIPQLAAREKLGEFIFDAVGFRLKMSPGNFVFLGPKKYSSGQITLASLFFSRPGLRPVVRTFLFVCNSINY